MAANLAPVLQRLAPDFTALVKLDAGGSLLAKITRKSLDTLKLQPGRVVYAYIKTMMLG